jgi:hypothetical protein
MVVSMRRILSYALALALTALAYGAQNTPAKKAAGKSSAAKAASKKAPVKSASARKSPAKKAVPRTTWRNRQTVPSPERYKEIQEALVAKGYLSAQDAGGAWNQNSVDALKRFQAEQKIDSSGKINSLSLIALGLGPKHDANPTKAPDPGPQNR